MAVNGGRFQKGVSGNPNGRPPKNRQDAGTALVPTTPSTPAGGDGGSGRRRDGWQNSASGHGTARDRRTLTRYGVDIVTDIEALQLWRSEFLAATIIEGEPTEALKRGWRFKCEDRDLEIQILKQAEDLGLEQALLKAAEYENAYGGAAIFPVLSGALGDLSTELDHKAIASVDAFHVFEPQELLPAAYYTDIRLPKFRKPAAYRLIPLTNGRSGFLPPQIIHESRLIIFPGTRVSAQTQPGQREGWGDSILCRPKQVIADFGLSWASAATLLHEYGKGTLEMDGFASMMAQADGLDQFDKYIQAMSMAWTTLGMVVIDGKSRYSRSVGTLAGISDVLNEFKVLMAAAAGRPVSTLFGQGQTGLRSGDDDTQSWNAKVEGYQSKHLRPRHEHAVKLMLLATAGPTNGTEPEAWSVEYPPISTPSEIEKADIQLKDMQRAQIAITTGVASKDDVAESFYKGETYSGDIKIDWERREQEAAQAQQVGTGEQPELSDEELQQLQDLQSEFGTEDGQASEDEEEPAPEDEEFNDEGDYPDEVDEEEREDDWRDDDQGYNPYRAKDGKFAPGAHKQKPSAVEAKAAAVERAHARVTRAEERIGKAKAAIAKHGQKVGESLQAKQAAHLETRVAIRKAQAAAELARTKPTQKNIKAAQVATNKATRLAVKVQKHDAAMVKASAAHAKATAAHEKATAAHEKATAAHAKATEAHAKAKAAEAAGPKPAADKPAAKQAPSVVEHPPAAPAQTPSPRIMSDADLQDARDHIKAVATSDEHSAAMLYSGHSYEQINGSLRSGQFKDMGLPEDRMNNAISHLDSLMNKSQLTEPVLTYRGSEPHPSFSNLKPGETFVDKAFVSTTTDPSVIFGAHGDSSFDGGVVFHITSPAGTKIAGIPSNYPKEKGMLLGRGTAFRLDRVEHGKSPSGDKIRIMHVTVVGQH